MVHRMGTLQRKTLMEDLFQDVIYPQRMHLLGYNKMKKYQQEGTPVYLDVQRSDGTYVRFFGKITNLSEDIPVAKATTRWGVDLATEAVAEIANDGTWLSDGLISLGGILDERPEFI